MWYETLERTAERLGYIESLGCDPGPTHCAFVLARVPFMHIPLPTAEVIGAWYVPNKMIGLDLPGHVGFAGAVRNTHIFAYESCGSQGSVPGETTFETAAMGGEVRAMMRPRVNATYMFSPEPTLIRVQKRNLGPSGHCVSPARAEMRSICAMRSAWRSRRC